MWERTEAILKFVNCWRTPVLTATVAAIELPELCALCGPVDQLPVLMKGMVISRFKKRILEKWPCDEYAMNFVMV